MDRHLIKKYSFKRIIELKEIWATVSHTNTFKLAYSPLPLFESYLSKNILKFILSWKTAMLLKIYACNVQNYPWARFLILSSQCKWELSPSLLNSYKYKIFIFDFWFGLCAIPHFEINLILSLFRQFWIKLRYIQIHAFATKHTFFLFSAKIHHICNLFRYFFTIFTLKFFENPIKLLISGWKTLNGVRMQWHTWDSYANTVSCVLF